LTRKNGQQSQGRRVGAVFSLRVSDEQRSKLEKLQRGDGPEAPRALGPWLVWRALDGRATLPMFADPPDVVQRIDWLGTIKAPPPIAKRIVLDLCSGSGSWSEPYRAAGYDVRRVTLPDDDVRSYSPPAGVWGVLCAPPCNEFSLAKVRWTRDLMSGVEVVSACLRIVALCRPQWWALENPVGLLGRFLGRPRHVFQPHDYGDPWTKRTALWGDFRIPPRGRSHVPPVSRMRGRTSAERAITPPGFARAFAKANP
jgi:hypothetical protein